MKTGYGAFGETTDAGPRTLGYTGRTHDGTGLLYLRERYYSPELKRFISEDPLGLMGGDANVNAYVGGNPVQETDPMGLAMTPAFTPCASYATSVRKPPGPGSGTPPLDVPVTCLGPQINESRDERDLPAKDKPNSTGVKDYGDGTGQLRDYGPDGKATTDYDFGHDHGSGDPHAHDWDWNKQPARQPGQPLRPGQ